MPHSMKGLGLKRVLGSEQSMAYVQSLQKLIVFFCDANYAEPVKACDTAFGSVYQRYKSLSIVLCDVQQLLCYITAVFSV